MRRPVVVAARGLKGPDARKHEGIPECGAQSGTKVPSPLSKWKSTIHTEPREAGGVFAGFIIALCGRWIVNGGGEAAIVCGRCGAPDRQRERQTSRRTHSGDGGTGAGGGFAPTAERARKREGVRGRSRPAAAWQALARASAPGRCHANAPAPCTRGAKAHGGQL
jgi:hypothetical protein